jgi:hypothetical protein
MNNQGLRPYLYNWDAIDVQGNAGRVWIIYFVMGILICDLSHGWTNVAWFCKISMILCRETQIFDGKCIQKWDLWFDICCLGF